MGRRDRRNQRLNEHIATDFKDGLSVKVIARRYRFSQSAMMRAIRKVYQAELKEKLNYQAPVVLGIDEHSIHKGRKYAISLVDLRNHRVYDVIEGRSLAAVESRIRSYKGRMNVKVVCMDLSPTMRSIAQRLFPNAKIVTDRFHVICLIIQSFLDFAREAEPGIRWKRGIIQLLRKHYKNLTPRQKLTLERILNDKPALKITHDFKERLCTLLNIKHQTERECRHHLRTLKEMMEQLLESPEVFKTLGKTMSRWFEPIIRMWRFTKSNGITEGFHRKMKLIQRRAYGFRNFENYRLRVLIECGGFHF